MMINLLISNTKRLALLFLSALILLLLFANSVFSQTPAPSPLASPQAAAGEEAATSFNYPIDKLGDCKNLEECTNYCEDPVNYNSCADFAKENGFYRDDVTTYGNSELWAETQNELGCNSSESCSQVCSQEANFDKCESYAKRNSIPGGYVNDPTSGQYLAAAKEALGCDSAESCASFCSNQDNQEKCSDFANQVGLQGGTTTQGPGGCQTGETCSAYCSDPANYGECSAFVPGGNFAGPGGCNSEESCRNYCDQNPASCRAYAPGSSGAYVSMECPAGEYHGPGGLCTTVENTQEAAECVGADRFWDGNDCIADNSVPPGIDPEVPNAHFEPRPEMSNCTTPGGCYDFCKENPDNKACSGFDPSGTRPTDEYSPYLYYTPGSEVTHAPVEGMGGCNSPASCYDYCTQNPGDCEGFSSRSPRPPEIYIPGTYYTPPTNIEYVTPPATGFYTTPIYYTPPVGSTYTTPQYYTPGMYSTPTYHNNTNDPIYGLYTTPNYYTT